MWVWNHNRQVLMNANTGATLTVEADTHANGHFALRLRVPGAPDRTLVLGDAAKCQGALEKFAADPKVGAVDLTK